MKYFNRFILWINFLLISLNINLITLAQNSVSYEQVDTIKINDSADSIIFIFKIDIKDIELEIDLEDLITHIDIYDFSTNSLIQSITDSNDYNFTAGGVEYYDINLDGYLDLDIFLGVFNLTSMHSFWLFDNLSKKYYYSREFSQLNDYSIDLEKKEIETHSQSTGGRGAYSEKYRIQNGNLSLIETEFSNYYNYERKELINGELITVALEREVWDKDDEDKHISIIEVHKLINDSLLLIEKSWLSGVDIRTVDEMYLDDIFNCGPWGGCLKYLRKEVYSYGIINSSYSIQDTTRYQVINNKWEIVEAFNK